MLIEATPRSTTHAGEVPIHQTTIAPALARIAVPSKAGTAIRVGSRLRAPKPGFPIEIAISKVSANGRESLSGKNGRAPSSRPDALGDDELALGAVCDLASLGVERARDRSRQRIAPV